MWIEGNLDGTPPNDSGPLVFGQEWLLEMIRSGERSLGFYWAPFAIIGEVPELNGSLRGKFVGFTFPGPPPAGWLTTSMMIDLGTADLARSPQELVELFQRPLPYVALERRGSALSMKARNMIASSYRRESPIADVARRLRVSHAHLTRQFKRDFGLTPVDYRHRLRVSEAMGKLSQGEKILDVAYDVGFNDANRFYKDFRKVTGTSPGKCRTHLKPA